MLKQPLWMPQILNELDSFDVGFLAATEKIRLIDNFDASFMVLKAVLDESRDVELWGPEAALLAKVLVSAWRKVGGKFLLKARDAFSLEGDISVDVNRINGLLEENGDLGKKLWNEVKKKVEAVINQTQVQALEFYLRQRDSQIAEKSEATDFTKEDWAKYVASSAQGHLETMLKGFPDRSVHDEIRRLAGIVDTNPLMRTVDRAALEKRILSLDKLGIGNLEGMADINVGRAWSWSGLELGSQQGITEYQIIAELDQKTCPVCERLHGRTFPLEKARGQMQDFMGKAHSAATLAAGMAFPRVSQVDNKSPEQIRAMAVSPPFHGRSFAIGTELYTNGGWKKVEELTGTELFLSPDPFNEMLLEWIPAKRVTYYQPDGRMIQFRSQNFDLLVTRNHEQIYSPNSSSRSRRWKIGKASDLISKQKIVIPRTALWSAATTEEITIGKWKIPVTIFVCFMAYWLSDGSVVKRGEDSYYITINKKKSRKKIMDSLRDFPIVLSERKTRIEFYDTSFGRYLMQFGHAPEKFIPAKIKQLPSRQIALFLEAYLICDGHEQLTIGKFSSKNGSLRRVFYTTSRKMADDIGECILKTGGYPSYILQQQAGTTRNIKGRKASCNFDVRRIYWNTSKTATFGKNGKGRIEEVPYEGMAYCVELERNHVLWVRRNGKTCFSGNCRCGVVLLW